MTPYTPTPLDTSAVALPAELTALLERLAENAHDVWAAGRLAEGWRPGPARDDKLKTHPGLVPYSLLSESEKEYDRQTAGQTVKAILALGFRLTPPEAAGG